MATQLDDISLAQPNSQQTEAEVVATDAFLLEECQKLGAQPLCRLCGQRCEADSAVAKYQSSDPAATRWRCRPCNNVSTMLNRRMKWPPASFSDLSEADQMEFWKSCKESGDEGGRFKYHLIRAQLVKRMCHRVIHEQSTEEFSEPKPLTVWEKEGWPAKEIEEKGIKSWHNVLGWVFEVPLLKKCRRVLLQEVEERIIEAEQAVTEKVGVDEKEAVLVQEDAEEVAEPDAKKSRKGAKATGGADEKKLAKQEQARIKKNNSKIQSLGTKVFNYLKKPMEEHKKVKALVDHHSDKLPPGVCSDFHGSYVKLSKMMADATHVVKQATNVATMNVELVELPFDYQQVVLENNSSKIYGKQLTLFGKALKLKG